VKIKEKDKFRVRDKWDMLAEFYEIESDDLLKTKSEILFDYNGSKYFVYDWQEYDLFDKEFEKRMIQFLKKNKDDEISLSYVVDELEIDSNTIKEYFLAEILSGEFMPHKNKISIGLLYRFLSKKRLLKKFISSYLNHLLQNKFDIDFGETMFSDLWRWRNSYIVFEKSEFENMIKRC
jgi:hypothetical protein